MIRNIFINTCPRCKSSDIVDQAWIWATKPNNCNKCSYEWEHSKHARIMLPIYFLGFLLALKINPYLNEIPMKIVAVVVIAYFPLAVIYMAATKTFYISWNQNDKIRTFLNYGSLASLALISLWLYLTVET